MLWCLSVLLLEPNREVVWFRVSAQATHFHDRHLAFPEQAFRFVLAKTAQRLVGACLSILLEVHFQASSGSTYLAAELIHGKFRGAEIRL